MPQDDVPQDVMAASLAPQPRDPDPATPGDEAATPSPAATPPSADPASASTPTPGAGHAAAGHPEPLAHAAPTRAQRIGFWLFAGHLWTLFGIALSNGLAGLMVLSAPWSAAPWLAARWGTSPRRAPLHLGRAGRALYAALAAYVLFLLVAVAASYEPATSLRATSELFTLATLALAPLLVRGERDVRRIVDGIVFVGGLVALHGLGQLFFGYGEIDRRIRGPFSHWMTFSGFLLVCDLLLIAALLFRRPSHDAAEPAPGRPARRPRGLGWRPASLGWRPVSLGWRLAALVAINAALLVSLTRSAWVGLALALGLAILLRSPRALLLVPPAAVVFVLLAPVPMLHRVASIADLSDTSNYDRLCMAEAGLRMIAERPLTGIGPEMVEQRYPIYRHPTAPRYWVPHLHNSFLQLAAERGLPALAAYLALLAASLAAAWGGFRREGGRRGPRADLWLGALLAVIGFNLAGLFEHNWGDTEVQRLVLFLLALPFCLAAGSAHRPPRETP